MVYLFSVSSSVMTS